MKSLSKIRLIFIVASIIIGIVYAIPNFFKTSNQVHSLNFLPGKKINLGLDLKCGSYLLLKANMGVVFAEKSLSNRTNDTIDVGFRYHLCVTSVRLANT